MTTTPKIGAALMKHLLTGGISYWPADIVETAQGVTAIVVTNGGGSFRVTIEPAREDEQP